MPLYLGRLVTEVLSDWKATSEGLRVYNKPRVLTLGDFPRALIAVGLYTVYRLVLFLRTAKLVAL